MQKQLEQVAEFHRSFNVPIQNVFGAPDANTAALRIDLLEEEVNELSRAFVDRNEIEILDALADILYIWAGTVHACGAGHLIDQVFDEVHRSNMSKLTKEGKVLLRHDGKILKSDQYSPPDIWRIVSENDFNKNATIPEYMQIASPE